MVKPVPVSSRPAVKIEWNNKSEEDFLAKKVFEGFDGISPVVEAQIKENEVKRFLSKVDTSKGPIQRSVDRMFRIRAPDHSSPKHEIKEWLYWQENWNEGPDHWAYDKLGQRIAPVMAHLEGVYYETLTKEVIETVGEAYDIEGNPEPDEQVRNRFDRLRLRYYIPFTKAKAEEVIKKSAYYGERGTVMFMVKLGQADIGPSGSAIRHEITKDMFLNWTFDELVTWMAIPWKKDSPVDYSRASIANVNKTANNLSFTPS